MHKMLLKTKTLRLCVAVGVTALLIGGTFAADVPQSVANKPADPEALAIETAVLTNPPNVPVPSTCQHSAKVIVNLEVKEVIKRLCLLDFWRHGAGEVHPRGGDDVEIHLNNHQDNKMPHSINVHAVTKHPTFSFLVPALLIANAVSLAFVISTLKSPPTLRAAIRKNLTI